MTEDNGSNLIWKAIFIFFGLGIFIWGIIGNSITRTMGGVSLLFLGLNIHS